MQLQTKYIFCNILATRLCMKPPNSSLLETPQLYRKRESVANGDSYSNSPQRDNTKISSLETTVIESMLAIRIQSVEKQNDNEIEENIKVEWMLAAAVLNRICAIVFVILFVVGTLTFNFHIFKHGCSQSNCTVIDTEHYQCPVNNTTSCPNYCGP